ncbi:MAG: hypothetical protein NTY90_00305 [Candidatus Micrarchaeota archaeon]|nr:hypothetical protein [Candidatus Micrarchaeota archaeon]
MAAVKRAPTRNYQRNSGAEESAPAKPAAARAGPRQASPLVPVFIVVVLVAASLAALYYAGFFSQNFSKTQYVCWNGAAVDSPDNCPARPAPQCPTPSCAAGTPTPIAVTEQNVETATQVGKQAIAATAFKVVDFKASGGKLFLILEYETKPPRTSGGVSINGITTMNDTLSDRPTGSWINTTSLQNLGDRTPWLSFGEESLVGKHVGENFSLTVVIYYNSLYERWILKGKIE